MIIINDTIALGDTLNTFATMIMLTKKNNEKIYSHWANQEAGSLFPSRYNHFPLSELPVLSNQKIMKISMHDVVRNGVTTKRYLFHAQHAVLSYYGFEEETKYFHQLEIEYPIDLQVPSYDFIISPYVLADSNRNWNFDNWQILINLLKNYYPNCSICVIGKSNLYSVNDLNKIVSGNTDQLNNIIENNNISMSFKFENVDFYLDKSLEKVCQLLSNVKKLFISLDTGTSHLMCAIRKPHLILYHNSVGSDWASYPEAHMIYKNMKEINPDEVFEKILDILK